MPIPLKKEETLYTPLWGGSLPTPTLIYFICMRWLELKGKFNAIKAPRLRSFISFSSWRFALGSTAGGGEASIYDLLCPFVGV